MSSGTKHEGVKITIIDTQFVRTDPLRFKAVVQSLTGKDSMPAGGVELERPGVTGGRMPLGAEQCQRIVNGSIDEGVE